jgi:hypothetical protein
MLHHFDGSKKSVTCLHQRCRVYFRTFQVFDKKDEVASKSFLYFLLPVLVSEILTAYVFLRGFFLLKIG